MFGIVASGPEQCGVKDSQTAMTCLTPLIDVASGPERCGVKYSQIAVPYMTPLIEGSRLLLATDGIP